MPNPTRALLVQAQRALRWNQRELAEHMGSSLRTVTRWQGGQSHFGPEEVTKLAKFVHPVDREIASQLLGTIGQTLLSAGLEIPAPIVEPLPSPPPPSPVMRASALRDLIDAVVCSVADATNVVPKVVRPAVLLSLRRAMEVGIDLEAAWKAGVLDGEATPGPAHTGDKPEE